MRRPNERPLTRLRTLFLKEGGFGLLEVLGVMVIVGLLATIAVPQIVNNGREQAAVKTMESDARVLGQAVAAFITEHDGVPHSVAGAADKKVFTIRKNVIPAVPEDIPAVVDTITKTVGTSISGYQRLNEAGNYTTSNDLAVGFRFNIHYTEKTGKFVTFNSITGELTQN